MRIDPKTREVIPTVGGKDVQPSAGVAYPYDASKFKVTTAVVKDAPPLPKHEDKWMIICDTICDGEVPTGLVHEEGQPDKWLTFDTEREAQLELVDDMEEYIRQFKDGEREYDDIFVNNENSVERVVVNADGTVTYNGKTFDVKDA